MPSLNEREIDALMRRGWRRIDWRWLWVLVPPALVIVAWVLAR